MKDKGPRAKKSGVAKATPTTATPTTATPTTATPTTATPTTATPTTATPTTATPTTATPTARIFASSVEKVRLTDLGKAIFREFAKIAETSGLESAIQALVGVRSFAPKIGAEFAARGEAPKTKAGFFLRGGAVLFGAFYALSKGSADATVSEAEVCDLGATLRDRTETSVEFAENASKYLRDYAATNRRRGIFANGNGDA